MAKKPTDELGDQEAEARATDALRRALATPYRPHKELKVGRKKKATKSARKRRSESR